MSAGKARVVVLGGGFAGLEAAFLLRARLGERAELTLVSDADEFLFKPNTIYIPFGADPASLLIRLDRPAHRRDIALVRGRAHAIDPGGRVVHADGGRLPYDFLVVATGAGMRPEEVYRARVEHVNTEGKYLFNPYGKTKAARRKVPLNSVALSIVKRRVERASST